MREFPAEKTNLWRNYDAVGIADSFLGITKPDGIAGFYLRLIKSRDILGFYHVGIAVIGGCTFLEVCLDRESDMVKRGGCVKQVACRQMCSMSHISAYPVCLVYLVCV